MELILKIKNTIKPNNSFRISLKKQSLRIDYLPHLQIKQIDTKIDINNVSSSD